LFRPDQDTGRVPQLTVKDVVALYRRHCAAEGVHGPAAKADREYTFGLFVAACGGVVVADLKPFHLTDFVEAHPEWRSISTRRAKANGIRAAFNWAFRQERIARNPFVNVQYAEHERRAEMPDDALAQLERVSSKQFEAVLRFLRLTGCRTGELCQATWGDMDLERGIWTIERHKSRRFTGRPKVVALVTEAVAVLRAILGALAATDQTDSLAPVVPSLGMIAPTNFIFRNTRGGPWRPGVLSYQLRRLKKRHGIDVKASLHGVRHRALSAMIEAGAPIKLVAEQAGHSTTAVTERFYWHRSEGAIDAMRAAAELGVPKK
jgi:integrase